MYKYFFCVFSSKKVRCETCGKVPVGVWTFQNILFSFFLTASLYIKEKADKTRDVATKHHNTFMFSINISNCPLLLSEAFTPCPW